MVRPAPLEPRVGRSSRPATARPRHMAASAGVPACRDEGGNRIRLTSRPPALFFCLAAAPCLRPSAHTYKRGRLWIKFLREFWGRFLGGFLETIGPGARVRGFFSADGVLLARWASANFDFFGGFFAFWGAIYRFLGPFSHSFHPCHVHTFMLITFFRRVWHGNCTAFTAEIAEHAEKGANCTSKPSSGKSSSTAACG